MLSKPLIPQAEGATDPAVFRAEILWLEGRIRQVRQAEMGDESQLAPLLQSLAEIEEELQRLQIRHRDRVDTDDADIFLADVEEVRATCERLNLPECAAEAEQITSWYVAESARVRREQLATVIEQAEPQACFEALIETTALELTARKHLGGRPEQTTVFVEMRTTVRDALCEGLRSQDSTSRFESDAFSPADADQQGSPAGSRIVDDETRDHWMRDLIDRSDMVLTSVEGHSPHQAAAQLGVVADDLQWYVAHVETRRGVRKRRLKRKLRQLRAEQQERALHGRLQARFGASFVRRTERLILLLICMVVGLIVFEASVDLSNRTRLWINVFDGLACLVFLAEFFVRLAMVEGRWWWFRRHFLIDFVPSIPIGLILIAFPAAQAASAVHVGLLGRVFRVARVARYIRAFGLLSRGLDRLARQYGHILNQNVILYPTRKELARLRDSVPAHLAGLRRLRYELRDCWRQLVRTATEDQRIRIVRSRLDVLQGLLADCLSRDGDGVRRMPFGTREVTAEVLIDQLVSATPATVEAALGDELVSQAARIVRIVSWAPLRWLPIICSVVPRLTPGMTESEITAATARRCGRLFKRWHERWFWVADLYGTVTPSQFVDRVGGMLVRSSFKPAYRLILFGGLFGLTNLLLYVAPGHVLEPIQRFLTAYVGPTLLILGSISFLVLGIGLWLQRVAREATEFYERSVQAQFLSLTEIIRSRYLTRDAQVLYDRVLRFEWMPDATESNNDRAHHLAIVEERIHHSLVKAHLGSASNVGYRGLDTTLLLYRDWLDGALFTDNDTRTTSQLLGNPAVRQVLSLSGRVSPREEKKLQKLDLVRQKSLLGGPYLWFNFISRSIAHSVASLLVDYNQHAIPLADLPLVDNAERNRYECWLTGATEDSLKTGEMQEAHIERNYVTNAFTALHFLDFDPQRDSETAHHFGEAVLRRLERDRSFLIRRIFGTYPMHNRPKEQRVVNLYALYSSWLANGRIILLPLFLLWAAVKGMWLLLKWICHSVQQVRNPKLRRDSADAAAAHFLTAVRKIERIRGPAVRAAMRLRMRIDPEYLGVPLPDLSPPSLPADVDVDLSFLHADPDTSQEVEDERIRAAADMDRLRGLLEHGLLPRVARLRGLPEEVFATTDHVRAAAIVYLGDMRGVRRHLSALSILHEVAAKSVTEPLRPGRWLPAPLLRRRFRQYWDRHGFGDLQTEQAVWRAVHENCWGARDALRAWSQHGDAATEVGERILGELLLHPSRLLEQLMTIRTIQTLSILDVLNYREHVHRLGRYAEMGDSPGDLLEWLTDRSELQAPSV